MKKCTKCKKNKKESNFHKRKVAKDGLSSWCKDCKNKDTRMFKRTKEGLICEIYHTQKASSKTRGMNLPDYSQKELEEWVFSKPNFNSLYENWVKSSYARNLKPSIDRIDDFKSYTIENIRLVTSYVNILKSYEDTKSGKLSKRLKKIGQYTKEDKLIKVFPSSAIASRELGINVKSIYTSIKTGYMCKGFKFKQIKIIEGSK